MIELDGILALIVGMVALIARGTKLVFKIIDPSTVLEISVDSQIDP